MSAAKRVLSQANASLQVNLKMHQLQDLIDTQVHANGLCLASELLTRHALNSTDYNSHIGQAALMAVTGSLRSQLETLGSMLDELMTVTP